MFSAAPFDGEARNQQNRRVRMKIPGLLDAEGSNLHLFKATKRVNLKTWRYFIQTQNPFDLSTQEYDI
ncbi:hypothetical protein L6164_013127 [Bauhinia variegata]|uniref:Uncharacterized protein n=1 Tax=Bauhinia variegata TaxID=167791 RepID=A0ACB9PBE1_BAUVA|nr:hypothetical protein L6164_013127 [Bauhinia variegata]